MGKVAARTNGFFNIAHASGIVRGIKHTYCKIIHKSDGYSYSFFAGIFTHKKAPLKSLLIQDKPFLPALKHGVSRLGNELIDKRWLESFQYLLVVEKMIQKDQMKL